MHGQTDRPNPGITGDELRSLQTLAIPPQRINPCDHCWQSMSDGTDFPRRGTIDFVDNHVSVDTGALTMRAVVANADHLLVPGLFMRIRLAVSEPRTSLLVPERAVTRMNKQAFLFVVSNQKTVERRPVKLGGEDDKLRVVEKGLAVDDWVIISGLRELQAGTAVEPERVSAPKGPKE
jgi:RND family efflux transporter MFP subunit